MNLISKIEFIKDDLYVFKFFDSNGITRQETKKMSVLIKFDVYSITVRPNLINVSFNYDKQKYTSFKNYKTDYDSIINTICMNAHELSIRKEFSLAKENLNLFNKNDVSIIEYLDNLGLLTLSDYIQIYSHEEYPLRINKKYIGHIVKFFLDVGYLKYDVNGNNTYMKIDPSRYKKYHKIYRVKQLNALGY